MSRHDVEVAAAGGENMTAPQPKSITLFLLFALGVWLGQSLWGKL
jgi:hypothetical protein